MLITPIFAQIYVCLCAFMHVSLLHKEQNYKSVNQFSVEPNFFEILISRIVIEIMIKLNFSHYF